ncbi:glycosyltransferase [Azospirillum rugosum]|uniref:Succinoglycan biosynthesis protein ExoM n=1 Tax=Azospirillum rugosum TaxID=416170 RepID=A0ABS4SHP1_9PROT|nr:glycosyltransferase [Azospirillum rugosum]MBP2291442.1 succinoglycan biosynthesis protein ExoM [Azospirillum rugosum]MDQ0525230.1 succinoglycan biosynthesis protein ExoM [Azospirillum rugosum]
MHASNDARLGDKTRIDSTIDAVAIETPICTNYGTAPADKPEMRMGFLRVDVCIATFKRATLLAKTLKSLFEMDIPDGFQVQVIVLDNDRAESARSVVAQAEAPPHIKLIYEVEPQAGVAHARNRALRASGGDYVAFVDDDETVDKSWLVHLLKACKEFEADVVFGPVLSVLPPNSPTWISQSKLFDRRRFPTGTPRSTGGAGSVLMTRRILERAGRDFNDAYNNGGEDTEFFFHLKKIGAKLIWCDEAIAWEDVPDERATIKWMAMRNYNHGRIYARVVAPGESFMMKVYSFIKRLMAAALLTVTAMFALVTGKHVAARFAMIAVRNFGQALEYFAVLVGRRGGGSAVL